MTIYYLLITRSRKTTRGYARFYIGTKYSRGSLEAKIKCSVDLVAEYAERTGFIKKWGGPYRKLLMTNEWENYARTLLYAAIISNLRKKSKMIEAMGRINSLDYLDLRYWAGTIISRTNKLGTRGIYRPAKALRILLYID